MGAQQEVKGLKKKKKQESVLAGMQLIMCFSGVSQTICLVDSKCLGSLRVWGSRTL